MESLITANYCYSQFGESFALLSKITNEPSLQSRNTTSSYTSKENSHVCTQEKCTRPFSLLLSIVAKKWK